MGAMASCRSSGRGYVTRAVTPGDGAEMEMLGPATKKIVVFYVFVFLQNPHPDCRTLRNASVVVVAAATMLILFTKIQSCSRWRCVSIPRR